jgi:hypothetical protein
MNRFGIGLAVICLTALLSGCGSVVGDADVGPDPGGGFYDGGNINVGHINPSSGSFYSAPYTSVGQLYPLVPCRLCGSGDGASADRDEFVLLQQSLLRERDRNPVEAHRIFEDQLGESLFP